MDERNDPLAIAVRRWAEEARRREKEHPAPERLVAYAVDGLEEDEAERLRDHLALCRACSRRVLELRAFPDVALPDVPALSPVEVEREWRRLWGGVREAERPTAALRRRSRPAPWVPWALAAGLFAATLGASGWVLTLQRRLQAQARPRTDAVLVEGVATGGTRRASGTVVASAAAPLVVVVSAAPPRDAGSFQWRIVPARGAGAAPVWTGPRLRRPDGDLFVLHLPPYSLAPGSYRLLLAGRRPSGSIELAAYELRIRP